MEASWENLMKADSSEMEALLKHDERKYPMFDRCSHVSYAAVHATWGCVEAMLSGICTTHSVSPHAGTDPDRSTSVALVWGGPAPGASCPPSPGDHGISGCVQSLCSAKQKMTQALRQGARSRVGVLTYCLHSPCANYWSFWFRGSL